MENPEDTLRARFSSPFGAIRDELYADARTAFERAELSQSASDKRAAIRAAFADLESLLFMIRELARTRPDALEVFTTGELAMLREEAYGLDSSGDVRVRPAFARFEDSLQFTLKMLTRNYGDAYELDKSGVGWQSLVSAIQIRHRVTHPKWPKDIDITPEQLAMVKQAWLWTHERIVYNMAGVIAHLENQKACLVERLGNLGSTGVHGS